MGVYYGMNGLWVPIGGQGGAAPVDPNLLAENIKSGVTISGVTGTFTNDGTAKASDMANGVTAYVNGEKVTGSVNVQTAGSAKTQSYDYFGAEDAYPNDYFIRTSYTESRLFRQGNYIRYRRH